MCCRYLPIPPTSDSGCCRAATEAPGCNACQEYCGIWPNSMMQASTEHLICVAMLRVRRVPPEAWGAMDRAKKTDGFLPDLRRVPRRKLAGPGNNDGCLPDYATQVTCGAPHVASGPHGTLEGHPCGWWSMTADLPHTGWLIAEVQRALAVLSTSAKPASARLRNANLLIENRTGDL